MPKMLTTREVALRVNKDHSQVRRAIAHGWLKSTKTGHDRLVSERDLKKWESINYRVYPNLNKRPENPSG